MLISTPQLSFMATGALLTLIAETGGTRHKAALTAPELEFQVKLQTAALVLWIATALSGKMAICFAILRLLKRTNKWHTWPVWIVMHLMIITCALDALLVLFRCGNPRNLWDLHDQPKAAACLDEGMVYGFGVFAAAWQVFVYFFLALYPMYIIWTLHMASSQRKYTIMTLLGLTTITGLAALTKVAVSQTSSLGGGTGGDSTWDVYVLSMCSAAEAMLLIVCGSVPVMVPVWDNLVRSCRQGYGTASGIMSGAGHSRPPVWSSTKEPESPQTKQSVDNGDLEDVDLEEAKLVGRSPKTIAELPSVLYARESLGYAFASKQGMADHLPRRWHASEKRWSRVEGEETSPRHCDDSAV